MKEVHLPQENASLTDWANFYASLKWPIIPLHNPITPNGYCSCNNPQCKSVGKHPRIKEWQNKATIDADVYGQWWKAWPNANIGIITGNHSGIFVVDIDPRHGGDNSLNILKNQFTLPEDSVVITGGDGKHYYFQHSSSPGEKLTNKANILPGIDIRAEGGFIVAPPSLHLTGKNYRWANKILATTKASEQFIHKISLKERPAMSAAPLFDNQPDTHQVVNSGNRNNFLASVAGSMRHYGLGHSQIEKQLQTINQELCSPGLNANEVSLVAKSISSYPTEHNPSIVSKSTSTITWECPKELPKYSNHAPNMDESFLPPVFKEWISDVTERMQVPIEFVAAPAIVSLSSLIGRKVIINPKQRSNWIAVPNLWGAIVARPGTLKSPSIAEALKPFEKIVKDEEEKFTKAEEFWLVEKDIFEGRICALKEQLNSATTNNQFSEIDILRAHLEKVYQEMKGREPRHKRIKTNDTTVEKLGELLQQNPNGILVFRDELSGWLSSLDKAGRETDRGFYLESWNGYGPYTIDRIGRGTKHIPEVCLSIFGGIQPDKLFTYLTSKLQGSDDGMLQRFQILICSELSKEWKNVDRYPNIDAQNSVTEIFEKIHRLNKLKNLKFSYEAQEIFDEWYDVIEKKVRSRIIKNSYYESHMAKYRSLVPSLAAIFHIIEKVSLENDIDTPMDKEAIQLAIKWAEYLDLHAKKIYQVEHFDDQHSVEALVEKLKEDRIVDGENFRSIYRHHWKHLENSDQVEKAAKYLEQFDWVKIQEVESKYNKVKILKINPYLGDIL